MKTIALFIAILLSPCYLQAQSKAIDALQKKYKGTEDSFTLNVNGNLIRMLMLFDGNEEDKDVKEFVKGVKHLKVMRVGDRGINRSDLTNLKAQIRGESFDELMTLRSNDQHIDILVREKNNVVSEFILLLDSKEEFMVLDIRGNIDLAKVMAAANKVRVKSNNNHDNHKNHDDNDDNNDHDDK